MKKVIAILVTFLAVSAATFAKDDTKSLLRNGDFAKKGGWRGDGKIISEGDSSYLRIEAHKSREKEILQEFQSSNLLDVLVEIKIKGADDYEGRGFEVWFTRDDGSAVFYNRDIKAGEWETHKIKFARIQKSRRIELKIIVKEGSSGYVYLDDVSVTPVE